MIRTGVWRTLYEDFDHEAEQIVTADGATRHACAGLLSRLRKNPHTIGCQTWLTGPVSSLELSLADAGLAVLKHTASSTSAEP